MLCPPGPGVAASCPLALEGGPAQGPLSLLWALPEAPGRAPGPLKRERWAHPFRKRPHPRTGGGVAALTISVCLQLHPSLFLKNRACSQPNSSMVPCHRRQEVQTPSFSRSHCLLNSNCQCFCRCSPSPSRLLLLRWLIKSMSPPTIS